MEEEFAFSEPDSETNIIFTAETVTSNRPVVKAGTLEKLVQRLTYEEYPGIITWCLDLVQEDEGFLFSMPPLNTTSRQILYT